MLVKERKMKPLSHAVKSSISPFPFDWSNVPRRLRTKRKRKLNGEEALSRPKEAQYRLKEALSIPKEAPSRLKEAQSRLKEAVSKPKEALSKPKEVSSRQKEAQSRLKEALSKPKEALSRQTEALSKPDNVHSQPKKTLSTPNKTYSRSNKAFSRLKEALSRPQDSHFRPKEALSGLKEKLDSGVFDTYMKKIWKLFAEDRKGHFTYFDSLWFSLYRIASSKDKVLTWIKKEPIFSKTYVFVPIVCWGHWSLLILCHFGESLPSTTGSRCMLLLDSLEMANPRRLEPEIRRFVLDIYKTGDRPETKHIVSQIPFLVPKVPQQRDGNECGFFVLYFINLFLKQAPDNFSMEGYPYFMKKDWFSFDGLDRFHEGLNSLN